VIVVGLELVGSSFRHPIQRSSNLKEVAAYIDLSWWFDIELTVQIRRRLDVRL